MDDLELRSALEENHDACFGWAAVCCRGDREMAADVLHSVYVSVLDGRTVFRGKSEIRTWLFGVIRNVARDARRGRWWSRVVRLDFESLMGVEAESIDVDESESNAIVQEALIQLPDRQREIIHLVFFEKLTIAGAAEVMNISKGSASQHYSRAKSMLRRELEPLWNARSGRRG